MELGAYSQLPLFLLRIQAERNMVSYDISRSGPLPTLVQALTSDPRFDGFNDGSRFCIWLGFDTG